MANKEEWQELEKWNESKKQEINTKIGLDIDELEKSKILEKQDKIYNIINKFLKIVFIIGQGVFYIALVCGMIFAFMLFK